MKFSVLLSVYARENPIYLKECFKSIAEQTLLPNEIIVVKDGPLTDPLESALTDCINCVKAPVKILSLITNCGLGISLQEGLKMCSHEYVARMDADDVCHKFRFEKQIDILKKNPEIDVIGSWIMEFNKEIRDLNLIRKVPELNAEIYAYAKMRNPMNHMTVLFKKSKVMNAGGYQAFNFMEDYYLWFRMMLKSCVFYNIQDSLVFARRGNDMISRRMGWTYFLMEKKIYGIFRSHRFITSLEYFYILIARFVARISPRFIVKFLYRSILRS